MPQSAEVGEARQWAAFVGRRDLVHYPSAREAGNRQAHREEQAVVSDIAAIERRLSNSAS